MTKISNELNQIHYFILCVCENFCETIFYGSETVINYGSDSDFLTSYGSGSDFLTSYGPGSGSTQQKVTVSTVPAPVPAPQHCLTVTS